MEIIFIIIGIIVLVDVYLRLRLLKKNTKFVAENWVTVEELEQVKKELRAVKREMDNLTAEHDRDEIVA